MFGGKNIPELALKTYIMALEKTLREEVTERLVAAEMERYQKELKELIKPVVEQITIESYEKFYDVATKNDRLNIKIKWE